MNPNHTLRDDQVREILIDRIDRQKQSVGIVAGIIEPAGRRIIAHGSLARGCSSPLDGDTIFEIGSLTKVFTSLVLADMVERGEATLDDPAARIRASNGKPITLVELATHTSGLPRVPGNLNPQDPNNPWADYSEDDLNEFLSVCELSGEPGFEYSNLGVGLLGHILATRAGMDYEGLVRTRVTDPLGMRDTGIALLPAMKQRMATGHNGMLTPVPNWDFRVLAGAGALRSSASDMLTLLEAFLGYRETPLSAAMKLMLDVRRPVGAGQFEIGLGWSIAGDFAWHDGGTGGFRSFAGYDLKKRTGVVVLSNASTVSGVDDIAIRILNPGAPVPKPEPYDPPRIVLIGRLDRYTGRYQLPDRILDIVSDGQRLFAQVTEVAGRPIAGPQFEMIPESEGLFAVKVTGGHLAFETRADGRITGLVQHRPGREPTRAPRLP